VTNKHNIIKVLRKALALHKEGKLDEAKFLYQEILRLDSRHFDSIQLLGAIATQKKQWANAQALYKKALSINPFSAAVFYNQGIVLNELQLFDESLLSYEKAIDLKPDHAEAYCNRGNVLLELNRLNEALKSYEKAIEINKDFAQAYSNKGSVLQKLNLLQDALSSYDNAIKLKSEFAEAFYNRGNVLHGLKLLEEAISNYDKSIEIKNDYYEAFYNRGLVLYELMRLDEAEVSFAKAIEYKPDHADAHWNNSLIHLLRGDFEKGFNDFEWRWRIESARNFSSKSLYSQPTWLGKDSLFNKTILLWSEQGLGDTLQFCRYAKLVSKLGAKVILEVQEPLFKILQNLEGVDQLVVKGSELPHFDYQCPLMSLPLAFQSNLATIPDSIPYIFPNLDIVNYWKIKLSNSNKLKVGLVWSGGYRPNQPELRAVNDRRNIPFHFFNILKDLNIDFFSLQKGDPAESEFKALLNSSLNELNIIDHTDELKDFTDTAGLIQNLDLVISVDTSTAHLAAAIGKPVWILNRHDICWRWLLDRSDSPWYPNVRLFRQQDRGDWNNVLLDVYNDLLVLSRDSCVH